MIAKCTVTQLALRQEGANFYATTFCPESRDLAEAVGGGTRSVQGPIRLHNRQVHTNVESPLSRV